jgi:hypothetical protein
MARSAYELVRNHLGSIEDFWVALERTKNFAAAERMGRSSPKTSGSCWTSAGASTPICRGRPSRLSTLGAMMDGRGRDEATALAFGRNLVKARRHAGFSQEKLAILACCTGPRSATSRTGDGSPAWTR